MHTARTEASAAFLGNADLLVAGGIPVIAPLAAGPLNNAVLLAFGVYHRSNHLQEELLASAGGDLRAYISLYKEAQERRDGAAWLRRLAQEYREEDP